MTISTVSGLSSPMNCMMQIEVTNMSAQATMRAGAYTIKVPFSSLSRTMQFIHRSGGKVVEVTKLSAIATLSSLPAIETPVHALSNPAPSATVTQSAQKPTPTQSKRGGKSNKR
jgi:hypothetical protein